MMLMRPTSSARVKECSSLDSGAGGATPASVDCSSCWWALQSWLSYSSSQTWVSMHALLPNWPRRTCHSPLPLSSRWTFPHPFHLSRLSLSVPPHVDRSWSLLAVTGGGVRCVCFSLTFILSGGESDDGSQCSQQ